MTACTNEWCGHPEDDHVPARAACTGHHGPWKCVCDRYTTEEPHDS